MLLQRTIPPVALLTALSVCLCPWALAPGATLAELNQTGGNTTAVRSAFSVKVNSKDKPHPAVRTSTTTGWRPLPSFLSAIAFGYFHPEDNCDLRVYNPNLRLLGAMLTLLFPIIFYAVYQGCCRGPGLCVKKKYSNEHLEAAAREQP